MPSWGGGGLAATAGYYPYDTSSLAAYGYGGAYGLAGTRKNVTRESTATLKAWLNEHKKNPYPTKGEKIMLAIISKMTLTQVRTIAQSEVSSLTNSLVISGQLLVCQRSEATEEGEQDDLGAKEWFT